MLRFRPPNPTETETNNCAKERPGAREFRGEDSITVSRIPREKTVENNEANGGCDHYKAHQIGETTMDQTMENSLDSAKDSDNAVQEDTPLVQNGHFLSVEG